MKTKIRIIVIAAVIVLVISFNLSNHIMHSKDIRSTDIYIPNGIAVKHIDENTLTDAAEYRKYWLTNKQQNEIKKEIEKEDSFWYKMSEEDLHEITESLIPDSFVEEINKTSGIENLYYNIYDLKNSEHKQMSEIDSILFYHVMIYDTVKHEYHYIYSTA